MGLDEQGGRRWHRADTRGRNLARPSSAALKPDPQTAGLVTSAARAAVQARPELGKAPFAKVRYQGDERPAGRRKNNLFERLARNKLLITRLALVRGGARSFLF